MYHLITSPSKSCKTQGTSYSCDFSASHFCLGGCWLRTKLSGAGQEFLDEMLGAWLCFGFFFFLHCINMDLSKAKLNIQRSQTSYCSSPVLHLRCWDPVSWDLMWCRRQTRRQNNGFAALGALCWDLLQGS